MLVKDKYYCFSCGACLSDKKVMCPGKKVVEKVNKELDGAGMQGHIKVTLQGKSRDKQIYENSQSGGLVSSVLISLLEQGFIEKALVTKMEYGNPPYCSPYLTDSREGILESQGSKYCPNPLLKIIDELREISGPIAIVGLPCHFYGLYNLMGSNPWLQEKTIYKLGLFCRQVMNLKSFDFFSSKANLSPGDYLVKYRDKKAGGVQGLENMNLFQEGKSIALDRKVRDEAKVKYQIERCNYCFDKLNILADLSFGDPSKLKCDPKGEGIIMVRTIAGEGLLDAVDNIEVREIDTDRVIKGQKMEKRIVSYQMACEEAKDRGLKLPFLAEKSK